jgi:lysophospholipase L1-like esterase
MRRRWLLAAVLGLACLCPGGARAASVVLVGDSIFWGLGAGAGTQTLAFQLQREMKAVYIFNHAPSGASMAAQFAPSADAVTFYSGLTKGITMVVIGLGVNDWRLNARVDYFEAMYDIFVQSVQRRIAFVACVAPLWSDREAKPNKIGKTVDDYRQAIRRVCDKPGEKRFFWNGMEALPPDRRFFVDGLHPNRRGYRRYAKWLRDRLRETLPKPAPAPVVPDSPTPEGKAP